MNLSALGLLITISLGFVACEKQPVQPASPSPTPTGPNHAATGTPVPGPSPVEPPARGESPTSPEPQETPENAAAAPTLSTPGSATPSGITSPAGGRPVFQNQAANDHLESYDAYIRDFKEAYRQMKQGEMAKFEAVIARIAEIQSKGDRIRNELSPEEQKEFNEYLARKAQELGQLEQNQ